MKHGYGGGNSKLLNNLYSLLHTSTSLRSKSDIAHTGALGNYLQADAPHDISIRPVAPIQAKQPNDQILQSTKGCSLALTILSDEAREVNILPEIVHSSLI